METVVGPATVTDAGLVVVDSEGDGVAVEISSVPCFAVST
jgi:hypothetical protein